ncbi:Rrf2 family transcriptional regulator [Falsiroseomonas sp.]|uniref:Rrf2 family transcriptional regulator n=1 Tax=Falsiroseomonas sp. TaxID=2870721 RepID=UPI003565350A
MRLAADPARHRSTEAPAGEVGVPRNHLHKIVHDLAGAGLVRALRGARGGVMLARPPARWRRLLPGGGVPSAQRAVAGAGGVPRRA